MLGQRGVRGTRVYRVHTSRIKLDHRLPASGVVAKGAQARGSASRLRQVSKLGSLHHNAGCGKHPVGESITMKSSQHNSATASNTEVSSACFLCKKPIVDGAWFCRLPQKVDVGAAPQAANILLCSSVCALRYLGDPQPNGNGFEPNYDGYEHSLPVTGGGQKDRKL